MSITDSTVRDLFGPHADLDRVTVAADGTAVTEVTDPRTGDVFTVTLRIKL